MPVVSQSKTTQIGVGSWCIFTNYLDAPSMAEESQIFSPGQHVVVAEINEDGGLQCFPTDYDGTIISSDGDTLFDDEVIHLAYVKPLPISMPMIE